MRGELKGHEGAEPKQTEDPRFRFAAESESPMIDWELLAGLLNQGVGCGEDRLTRRKPDPTHVSGGQDLVGGFPDERMSGRH
jgi:hypothetical protein